MFPINPYHRDLIKPTFIYAEGSGEVIKNVESEKDKDEVAEVKPNSQERIDKFKNNYNPEMWERELEKSLSNIPDNIKNRLKADAIARYKTKYDKSLRHIYKMKENHNKVVDEMKEGNEEERELIGNAVKNLKGLNKSKSALKQIESRNEIDDRFEELLDALHAQYFNFEWQEQHLTEDAFDEYRALAGDKWYKSGFKDNMEDYLENQLDYILENKQAEDQKWLKQKLTSLENRLTERYKLYANEDGFIDLAELKNLERGAKKYIDVIQLINSGENIAKIAKQAEYKELFDNESWHKATDTITEHLIADAKKNGTEASFIKVVQEMSGNNEEISFSDAISEFRDIMSKRADAGVKETITAVEKFNKAVNGELTLDRIQPASIHNMVQQERALLLGGFTKPIGKYDRSVVEFISTDRNGRNIILNNPNSQDELFLAIQNVLTHYPTIYKEKYKSLPRERSQLTNSRNPDKPHEHNKAARLLAVITLAEEAEWVIKNFDQAEEYKEQKLLTTLGDITPDKLPPAIMKFHAVNKLHSTSYVSALSRGGFNGRDMLMGAGKILAALTIFANLMQARKQEKLFSLDHLQNPALIAAGVGWIAIDKSKQYAGFFSEGAGDRIRRQDHSTLDKLAKNAGRKRLQRFIETEEEFAVMKDLSDNNPKAIKKLLEEALKRDPENPKLTKNILENAISKDGKPFFHQLPDTGNDRTRYLFYESFLKSKPRNIHADLRENCKAWI